MCATLPLMVYKRNHRRIYPPVEQRPRESIDPRRCACGKLAAYWSMAENRPRCFGCAARYALDEMPIPIEAKHGH